MTKMIREVITPENFPDWVKMTYSIREKLKLDSDDMLPWVFMDKKIVWHANQFTTEQNPARILFAFAYREDSDEVACFDKNKPGKVVIVFNEEKPPSYEYPGEPEFASFEEWYNYALDVDYGEH